MSFAFTIKKRKLTPNHHCHPEGAQRLKDLREILRFAQDDNFLRKELQNG
jgi:hypothetical protein